MRVMSYTSAITEALREEMARDPSVVMWGEDIAAAGGAFCHFACDSAPVVCSNGAPGICGNGAPLAGKDLAG